MDSREVLLRLTEEEALVLFEWLARLDSAKASPSDEPAERQVLWVLEGQLEHQLIQPLADGYPEALAAARRWVRERYG